MSMHDKPKVSSRDSDSAVKIVQYPVFDRGTRLAQLKLDNDLQKNMTIGPQPHEQAHGQQDYYRMKASKHGVALIINNSDFKWHHTQSEMSTT